MNWDKILNIYGTDLSAFVIRCTIGVVVFPHGAQKLTGWFGGQGFMKAMDFFTGTMNLPWLIGFLVIFIESLGSVSLIVGFGTRFFSLAMLLNFIGIIYTAHLHNGFFMNWAMKPNVPEGFEYHLLVIGLSLAGLILGGGKWSIDELVSQ